MRCAQLILCTLWIMLASTAASAGGNTFAKGDHVALLVTEFTRLETARDKSYSMISGTTITGRQFSLKAVWGLNTLCSDYLEKWKATPRAPDKPYYIAGFLKAESPMVVEIDACVRDPKNVDRSRKDIY